MITIKEIAEKLGISPTTVSNVIHGRTEKMSEETRKKVEMALVSNHYVNESRQKEEQEELKLVTLDFCLGENVDVMNDPFCAGLMSGISRELKKSGRYLLSDSPSDEESILRKLSSRNVEGAIVMGISPDRCESLQKRSVKPIVFIDAGDGNYDNVGLQDQEGARELTAYLLRQGHRKIAFFFDAEGAEAPCSRGRYAGFLEAYRCFGLSHPKEDCFYLPKERYLRAEFLRQFGRTRAGTDYTAAFFLSDLAASEAVGCFFAVGLSIPEDLSVSGFDDNIYARLSRPALTTVRQLPEEKAKAAVALLMDRIYGREVIVRSLHLPTELIVRESVRNIGNEKGD